MKKIRTLVVDDSATMRQLLTSALNADEEIEVIGQAAEPYEARQLIKLHNPDVITLDIEMPGMNGLEFLEKIMALRPMPVVMVSTLTKRGASATIQALELGAADYVAKPSPQDPHTFKLLTQKVKQAAQINYQNRTMAVSSAAPALQPLELTPGLQPSLIAIGASTGGVEALVSILRRFPKNCPPTIITQHMPALFVSRFVKRLNSLCQPEVKEAGDNGKLEKGCVYLASGDGAHMQISGGLNLQYQMVPGDPVNGHRPSVDVMFDSAVKAGVGRTVGIILTGMGRDGAAGLLAMREAGARTIGQNEASCVVYGMPKAAFECGAVETQLPLEQIASEILTPAHAA